MKQYILTMLLGLVVVTIIGLVAYIAYTGTSAFANPAKVIGTYTVGGFLLMAARMALHDVGKQAIREYGHLFKKGNR